jgi:glycosyltransferase involved in cell wall biosynthesis
MADASGPSISAVIAAYQAEDFIGEALDSVLGQTSPPDEVVVVDDGSTDRTARILDGYGSRIRVVRQDNQGYPSAMNRAIREARGAFVAPCGADDIWEPHKLEWQREAIQAHPDVAVHFGHAVFFGTVVGDHPRPRGQGVLDGKVLWQDLFRINTINMPSAVLARDLFERIGWFKARFLGDDYDFFFRCLRAGVSFYYEPRTLVRYRQHGRNITHANAELREAMYQVRARNSDLVDDRRLVSEMLAPDLFRIGRRRVEADRPAEARRAFLRSLGHWRGNTPSANLRALVWVAILSFPPAARRRLGETLVSVSRALDSLRGVSRAAMP